MQAMKQFSEQMLFQFRDSYEQSVYQRVHTVGEFAIFFDFHYLGKSDLQGAAAIAVKSALEGVISSQLGGYFTPASRLICPKCGAFQARY